MQQFFRSLTIYLHSRLNHSKLNFSMSLIGWGSTFSTSHWYTFEFESWRRATVTRNIEFQSWMVWVSYGRCGTSTASQTFTHPIDPIIVIDIGHIIIVAQLINYLIRSACSSSLIWKQTNKKRSRLHLFRGKIEIAKFSYSHIIDDKINVKLNRYK